MTGASQHFEQTVPQEIEFGTKLSEPLSVPFGKLGQFVLAELIQEPMPDDVSMLTVALATRGGSNGS